MHQYPPGPDGPGNITNWAPTGAANHALISSELDGKPRTAWVKAKVASDIRRARPPPPTAWTRSRRRERTATAVIRN